MMNDLESILVEGESYTVEFKESPDKELPEEVCAFANVSWDNEGRVRYDEIIREDLPVDGYFNEEAYKKFLSLAKITDVHGRDIMLKNLKCAADIRGRLCFTNAGALFFRKNDDDIEFRHAGIVCALYKGTNKVYILDAKELNGDLLSKIDDAIVFLKKHLRLSYKIESTRRENILELPERALLEAVVNAACHRDYFEKGARVMVEIFDDRVVIISPGGVCKGITPENFGTVSITRNNIIATLLNRCNYIEQMGTGIERMKNAAREAHVAEPEFEFSGFFKVTFRRNEPDIPIGRQSAVNRPQSATAADREQKFKMFIEKHGQVKVSDLIEIIDLSEGRVRELLRKMVNDGVISKNGKNRYAYYTIKL